MQNIVYFANEAAGATKEASGDLFGSLGIDWKMLVLQTIAFLLLLWLLSKFVYPVLSKMIDEREKAIEDSVKSAREAEALAEKASAETAKLMKQARKDADAIVASAKDEAAQMVEKAEKKSRERSERIVADAEEAIAKNVAAAKQSLRAETLGLVAEATEKVVGSSVNGAVDKTIVEKAVKEAGRA